jgi:hypothetical protein
MVKVNFADIEEFSNLPGGKYHVRVTNGEVKEHGDEAKHPGNEYWNIEITVQDGELEGRTDYVMLTLPPYTPYTLANLLRATVGQHRFTEAELDDGDFDVEIDDIIDNELEAVVTVRPPKKDGGFSNYRFSPFDPDEWEVDNSTLP